MIHLIPSGPKNLKKLFPHFDFSTVGEYTIEVVDENNAVIATTPTFKANCCPDGGIRVHFLNYLGNFDAVNFQKPTIEHEDESQEYRRSVSHPLKKTDAAAERWNVRSNDTYTAKLFCNEGDLPFLQEVADSPKMFLEWKGTEGQQDSYIPVNKIDGKFTKVKNVQDFAYEFMIEFKLANEFIPLSN